MACFLVPAAEAIVTTIVQKTTCQKAKQDGTQIRNPLLKRINLLNTMLWGGSALLAFEHVWHGEVTPWFPFLTNASNAADAAEMLRELSTSGTAMAVLVTAVWVGIVALTSVIEKTSHADMAANGGDIQ